MGHVPGGILVVLPVATVLRVLPDCGNLVSRPPATTTFPLLPIPGKAPEALLHPAISPLPKKPSYWESQHFPGGSRHPPTRKHPPAFLAQALPPGRLLVLGFSHCMVPLQQLALPPAGMLPGSNPSVPAALKSSEVFQGCHSPAGYLLMKTHIVKIQGNS